MKTLLISSITTAALTAATWAERPAPTKLFNGKDLTGWQGEGYVVKDGAIVCSPKGRYLMTKKQYSNYVLKFEFKLPPGGNNGIGIHYPGKGNAAYTGMEIQILDDTAPKYKKLKPYQFHGSLYTLKAADKAPLKPVGEWNKQKVTVNGPLVTIEVNGVVINKANLDELNKSHPKHAGAKRRSGHICFCGHGDAVAYRNITIVEIPATTKAAPPVLEAPKEEGLVKIYNESDLKGFIYAAGDLGHWQPRGKVLHYDGKSIAKEKNLWTEKEYADFILYCDWRWTGPATKQAQRPVLLPSGDQKKDENGKPVTELVGELDTGIYLRGSSKSQVNIWNWPCGSGEVYGYRTDRRQPAEVRAGVTPKVKADKPIGEWNRFKITMKGEFLTVELNGKVVLENAKLPGVKKSGRLAFQHHGSPVEFANIYIKELK